MIAICAGIRLLMSANGKLHQVCIDGELAGPVHDFVGPVVPGNWKGSFHAATCLRSAIHLHGPADVAVGDESGVSISEIARELTQNEPAQRDLHRAGQAGPTDRPPPVPTQSAG